MSLDPERWRRVEDLYHAALEREPAERGSFLAGACAGDVELLREVESLVAQAGIQDAVIDRPVWEVAQTTAGAAPAAAPARLSAGDVLGPYRIVAPIGAGGMGEVYRARDTRLARDVAVKVLPATYSRDPDRMRRFEQEARMAGALNHPNVLVIYDVGANQGSPYIVSELLDGETLRTKLGGKGLPRRKALDCALQIARGLAAAHQKGIVHRDLKPENIFVTGDGRLKILDFGLAKLSAPPEASENASTMAMPARTEPGVVMGTAGYMSPEQVRGQSADARADIFAFGAILYEMLSGGRAFGGDSVADAMSAVLKEEPPPLDDAALDRLVRRCLEKSPDQRWQSARDIEFHLQAIADELPSQPGAAARGRRWAMVAAPAAIVMAAVAAFLAGRNMGGGGAAASPVFRQLTFGRGFVEAAAFAPDGQTVVYSAMWEGRPMETFETRLGNPGSRSLFPGTGLLSISSSGELALSLGCEMNWGNCQGTLARVPLAGGAPRPVVEQVDFAAWAPDGNSLAIARAVNGKDRIEYPVGTVWYESKGWITSVAVSNSGDRVAFYEHPVLGNIGGALVVVDRAGRKKELFQGSDLNGGLAWARDDREVWFDASKNGRLHSIFAVSMSGETRKVLDVPNGTGFFDISRDGRILLSAGEPRAAIVCQPPDDTRARDLSWFDWSTVADLSPDGKTLLFYEWGDAVRGHSRVFLRKTDGSPPLDLGEGRALALSPDGKWALAVQETTPPKLIVLPTGAGQPRILPESGIAEFYTAFWFPDNNRIGFIGSQAGHSPRSYVQDIGGGKATALTDEGTIALLISPDGSRMLIHTGPGGAYFIVPAHGDRIPVEGFEQGDFPVQWTADGRALYIRAHGQFSAPIYRLDLSTGQRKLWKTLAPADPAGVFNIAADSGLRLTPDGKAYAFTYWSYLNNLFVAEGLK